MLWVASSFQRGLLKEEKVFFCAKIIHNSSTLFLQTIAKGNTTWIQNNNSQTSGYSPISNQFEYGIQHQIIIHQHQIK